MAVPSPSPSPRPEQQRRGLSAPGLALLVGVFSAAVAAIPAALRADSSPTVWLTLAGAGALVLGPALAGIGRARPVTGALFSTLAGLGLSALPLALLAAKLKEATHHRPLGAVTFAVLAAFLVFGAVVFCLRVIAWTGPTETRPARAWVRAGMALAALAGPSLLTGLAFSAPGLRGGVLDVALAFGAALILGTTPWPAGLVRTAARAGLPIWVAVVGVGLLFGLSGAGDAARLASPVLFAPFGWFAY